MTQLLAIDPGSSLSAWVELDGNEVVCHAKEPNEDVLLMLLTGRFLPMTVVIESMSPRGLPTSLQEMEAIWWSGRFWQAASRHAEVHRISRDEVKLRLSGRRSKVNDAAIRAILIDRYGGIGGKAAAVGLKASPGPLYGVKADVWAALAVGLAWQDGPR